MEGQSFALLYRPESADPRRVEVLTGDTIAVDRIDDLPVGQEVLAMLPYQQIAERGFACRADDSPLLALRVRQRSSIEHARVLAEIPDVPIELSDGHFDLDDDEYAAIVRRVIDEEIGTGEGSNFVIKRSFLATIRNFSPSVARALFRRLLLHEVGAYWTFVVHTPGVTFVGASPERHMTVSDGVATMNPISGTYRYPPNGSEKAQLLEFLGDAKEADELYMVLDEELKMMAAVCEQGGRVIGPRLKEMAHLAHTEYFLQGRTNLDVKEVLRRSLFAPTVTGSPLESACRAIQRHEPKGRGYYSGAIALINRDATAMDSAILIRTAEISPQGSLSIGVGATLVRHSDPFSEAAETRAKATALVKAMAAPLGGGPVIRRSFGSDPEVLQALCRKNETLAPFWLELPHSMVADGELTGHRILIVDGEDTFTEMLAHQIRMLGPKVEVSRFDEPVTPEAYDLVVIGPGPGDPRDLAHPKIAALRSITGGLLAEGKPLLAVCLGHQILSGLVGLELVRKPVPHQGKQRVIDLFGTPVTVGFYNTFTAVGWDGEEVHALRGKGFRSFQFHPESVLSMDGLTILRQALTELLPGGSR